MELIYRTVDPESPGGMKISVGEAKLGSERFDKHNKRIFEGDLVRATDPQTGDVIEGPVEFYSGSFRIDDAVSVSADPFDFLLCSWPAEFLEIVDGLGANRGLAAA